MISEISIYRAPTTVADTEEIVGWLNERVGAEVGVKGRFLDLHRTDGIAEEFADARVLSPYERETGNSMLGIVRYEERALENPEREGGVLYDGIQVQRALNRCIPESETSMDHLHVALVDRAIGTWGDHDGRWHKRVNILGQPSIISVPGLYEAPAKPEEYYKQKQKYAMMAGDVPPREILENEVEGDFLIEDDPRTTDALKGYVLQAVDYWETGDAFCEKEECRLYNAHRQSGVVKAQLKDPEFCDKHSKYEVSDS